MSKRNPTKVEVLQSIQKAKRQAQQKIRNDAKRGINANSPNYPLKKIMTEIKSMSATTNYNDLRGALRKLMDAKTVRYIAGESGTPIRRDSIERLKQLDKQYQQIQREELTKFAGQKYQTMSGKSAMTVKEANERIRKRDLPNRTGQNVRSEANAQRLIEHYQKIISDKAERNRQRNTALRENMRKSAWSNGQRKLSQKIKSLSNEEISKISVLSDFVDLFFHVYYEESDNAMNQNEMIEYIDRLIA